MRRSLPVVFSVTFVRHGETVANREHRIQGHRDVPLSSLGETQAKQAGLSLCKYSYNRVYASDLSRAYDTCQLILQENAYTTLPISIDTRLRERNFGTFEGMHIEEAKTLAAAAGHTWFTYNPPGAETLGNLQARMVAFFKELCQSVYDKNSQEEPQESEISHKEEDEQKPLCECVPLEKILIVSHGAALKQLYTHLHKTLGCQLPGDPEDMDILNKISPNTGISEYIIRFSPKKYNLHCVRIHDGDHLE